MNTHKAPDTQMLAQNEQCSELARSKIDRRVKLSHLFVLTDCMLVVGGPHYFIFFLFAVILLNK